MIALSHVVPVLGNEASIISSERAWKRDFAAKTPVRRNSGYQNP